MRGKAAGSSGDYSTAGDHPRVCGEKIWLSSVCVHASGSPPRMRGKVPGLLLQHLTHGITPAYAGKSHPSDHPVNVVKDHPRVCGEKQAVHSTWSAAPGSPPRMRGKVYMRCCACRQPRITPAYAGKSHIVRGLVKLVKDHPRVCGEKYSTRPYLSDEWGSPPRMRGKVYSLISGL